MSNDMVKKPTHNNGIIPKNDKEIRPVAIKTVDGKPVAIGHRKRNSK